MSANLDLVRSIYADWERGDFASAEWADPEIEYVVAGGPSPGVWTGVASMGQAAREFMNAWKDFRVVPEEFRELDSERVLVLAQPSASGQSSGLEMQMNDANVFHIRDRKVVRLIIYYGRERALADLGLED